MKPLLAALILAIASLSSAQAADVPPSEASLKKMFETIHASSMLDSIWGQLNDMMKTTIRQSAGEQPLNEAQQAIANDMATRVSEIFRESMSWDKLEPIMIRAYQKSLTQSEVDGIAKFYESPAGQAMIRKVPLLMQNSMQEMQGMMKDMMPKIQAVARESAQKIEAAATPVAASPEAASPARASSGSH